jgi:hypothetical protein
MFCPRCGGTVLQCYMLVDVYQNRTWTETVEFG